MLKKLWFMAVALMLSTQVAATEIDRTQPYDMIKEVSSETFARLKADQTIIQGNPDHLKVIVEEELMPYVNEKYAALKLLGSHTKKAKRADVGQFIKSFRGYLVASYAQVLTQYTDQEVRFGPEPKLDGKKRITSVKVAIVDNPRPDINLEFKLRKNKKTGEWQAFDMVAEGISLLSSKQAEWNSKIRKDGILAVAAELENLANQPIRFEAK